jgi:hypothetical protein
VALSSDEMREIAAFSQVSSDVVDLIAAVAHVSAASATASSHSALVSVAKHGG